MKSPAKLFFQVLLATACLQFAYADETGPSGSAATSQDAEARVQALQQELSAAKDRVAELEAELIRCPEHH